MTGRSYLSASEAYAARAVKQPDSPVGRYFPTGKSQLYAAKILENMIPPSKADLYSSRSTPELPRARPSDLEIGGDGLGMYIKPITQKRGLI